MASPVLDVNLPWRMTSSDQKGLGLVKCATRSIHTMAFLSTLLAASKLSCCGPAAREARSSPRNCLKAAKMADFSSRNHEDWLYACVVEGSKWDGKRSQKGIDRGGSKFTTNTASLHQGVGDIGRFETCSLSPSPVDSKSRREIFPRSLLSPCLMKSENHPRSRVVSLVPENISTNPHACLSVLDARQPRSSEMPPTSKLASAVPSRYIQIPPMTGRRSKPQELHPGRDTWSAHPA